MDKSIKNARQEALMYLSEIIQANRAIKELMLKNTYYSILLLSGVFYIFKDSETKFEFVLAVIAMILISIFSYFFISSNSKTIANLREKEKKIIKHNHLTIINKYWAGDSLGLGDKNPFSISYIVAVILTGLFLTFLLFIKNDGMRDLLCGAICETKKIVESIDNEN